MENVIFVGMYQSDPGRKDTIKACIYVKELVCFMLYRLELHEHGVELW